MRTVKELSIEKYVWAFAFGEGGDIVYIIKTSRPYENEYIVVHDDAHSLTTGNTEIITKEAILSKYGININQ